METKSLKVSVGGYSTQGVKEENQDAFTAHCPEPNSQEALKGIVCVMADGVSASAEAKLASQTAATHFINDYYSTADSWSVQTSANKVLTALNRWLYQQGNSAGKPANSLVTTFSSLIIKSTTVHCLHIGDSRVYRIRQGEISQLTRDHRSNFGAQRSYLTRALGIDAGADVDYLKEDAAVGDLYVLTTDGLHDFMSERQIFTALINPSIDLEAEAKALVMSALELGSDDNISCLLVHIDELAEADLNEVHRQLTQLPIPPVLAVGNSIDGYRVEEVLFTGTRSHLYLVRDEESDQLFALKAPSENFSSDPIYLDGFIKEEWVGRRISHPSLMKIYPPLREKHFLYYLAEYIPGQTLRQWMTDNPNPSLEVTRELMQQITRAARALERMDMIHQDIKPENIIIDRQGRTRLIDYGTVIIKGIDEISSPLDNSTPQGSVNYVAPEYLLGQKGSHRSDIFSIGVICYEILTGKYPYAERPTSQPMIKGYGELDYHPARHIRTDLPEWVEGCIAKACSANPNRRYHALSEFMYDLNTPNKTFQQEARSKPLIEKNPLLFWKCICGLLAISQIIQLIYWLN